jgi:hypothetical protein
VANDDVYTTITLYMTEQISKEEAIARFKVKELFNQYVFCNEDALSHLEYLNAYEVGE